ncbi:ABC transporter substrate-binding protein [Chitinasiproducens palmae]|uniref:Amino acid/amide ABC transporter substrate-binding protein, HAAT family n=1 Tax=Chitinasiproducens palmae TaxID=1770053 RepID=A0A1H2PSK8_9BURK|nr:ABC transporter substrate-binding protein [Chitinasiproducens palmae]SDV49961.1 amino acid/amide ABC transporter substrate-binding protein, HAAT family [Chitinasiproducens palmae]
MSSITGKHKALKAVAVAAALFAIGGAPAAWAQIKIGVTVSSTGPQASLGIPEKNAITLLPRTIAGQSVEYIVLDDASDTNRAVTNTKKLISEDHVDAIIGSTTTPNTLAMIQPASEGQTPVVTLASSARLVEPMDAQRRWIFKTPHNDSFIAEQLVADAVSKGLKRIGFIGFNNALGDAFAVEIKKAAAAKGLTVVADERFAPGDSSATAQALKVLGAKPDAIVIGGSGTPAALPARALRERGYKGVLYFNHGVSNNDFLRVCGADCNGALVATGPVLVASQLAANNPVKPIAEDLVSRYEKAYGAGSVSLFAGYTWDAGLYLQRAIPGALKAGKPGTQAFRTALRDQLESIRNLPTATGIITTTASDHVGMDQRSRVMVVIDNGRWRLVSAGGH